MSDSAVPMNKRMKCSSCNCSRQKRGQMCPGAALNRYLFLYLSFDFYMFNEIELTTVIDRKYTE